MHQSVLLREATEALVTAPGGFYVDGTFGRGGHSRAVLARLNDDGRVLGVDKDPQACEAANTLSAEHCNDWKIYLFLWDSRSRKGLKLKMIFTISKH